MADFTKRTRKARKQAAKRATTTRRRARVGAKATRKAVSRTSSRTRAQGLAALVVAGGFAALINKLVRGTDDQRYADAPETLPNTPERPAATTTPPATGAATAQTGADTGPQTETERARVEQTG